MHADTHIAGLCPLESGLVALQHSMAHPCQDAADAAPTVQRENGKPRCLEGDAFGS